MKELTLQAKREALVDVQEFIENMLTAANASMRTIIQVSVCVEEIYINIASYAYHPSVGDVTVYCAIEDDPTQVFIRFEDSGAPFDPLAKKDADITLSAQEREIGGLGILMVKKTMNSVDYTYENGKNILTMRKTL